jgi:hypothetical protein
MDNSECFGLKFVKSILDFKDLQYVAKSIGACKKKSLYIINQNHIFPKIIVKSLLDRF